MANVFISQNLVPNPSFETYTLCPSSDGQIEVAIPWSAATATSSTDYYNSCSVSYNVPNYPNGFQNAHSGYAYAGLFFYGVREYLQIQLSSSLTQNKTYYVEFFVNLNNAAWFSPCNNIGANLSINRPLSFPQHAVLVLTPHVVLLGNPIITDTINWVKISGCYTAQGGEQYLTIGNFFDNANTQGGATSISYCFIDDVLVEEITGQCTVGINEHEKKNVVDVYPNPNNGNFNVSSQFDMEKVDVISLTGEVLQTETINAGNYQLQLNHLSDGIYFIRIVYPNGLRVTRKIIINH